MTNRHGGKRSGAGRPQGARNRATREQKATLSELAREHTFSAIETLVAIMENGESENARISAAIAILDRGYGRPRQAVEMEVQQEDGLSRLLREISARGSKPHVVHLDGG